MKNTLAENMLRFGVKNLKESDIKHIKQAILQEQNPDPTNPAAVSTLESAWADPRLKSDAVTVTAGELKAAQAAGGKAIPTTPMKKNNIIWENLVKYYPTGAALLGKNAVGWKPFDFSQQELLLPEAVINFKIADIFVGKNHVLQGSTFTPGDQDCIYICSEKMYVKPRKPEAPEDGYVGNFYISPGDWNETALDIKSYYALGIPKTLHLRIVGTNVFVSNGYAGQVYKPAFQVVSPLSNNGILNSLKAV